MRDFSRLWAVLGQQKGTEFCADVAANLIGLTFSGNDLEKGTLRAAGVEHEAIMYVMYEGLTQAIADAATKTNGG